MRVPATWSLGGPYASNTAEDEDGEAAGTVLPCSILDQSVDDDWIAGSAVRRYAEIYPTGIFEIVVHEKSITHTGVHTEVAPFEATQQCRRTGRDFPVAGRWRNYAQ